MGMSASVAGAVTSAGSAYSAAQGQRSALAYQASVARSNAVMAGHQASDTIVQGQAAEGNQRLKTGQLTGNQRAHLAASGVDLGEGNANEVLSTTKLMGERDALQVHDNAMMAAWGYRTQQQNFLDDAQNDERTADSISPWMAAGTSLLTGATKVAGSWDAKAKANGTADFGTSANLLLSKALFAGGM